MGWSNGTEIFDQTMKTVLEQKLSDKSTLEIAEVLKNALQNEDWDTEDESEYYEHPVIGEVFGSYDD